MKYIKKVSASYQGDTPIATSITSTSTNDEVAGAKAVYDFAQDNYSTTEQRIGTWIDGKPLYEKTINYTSPITATQTAISHNISNLEKAFMVNGYAIFGTTEIFQIPCFRTSSTFLAVTRITPSEITVEVGSGWQTVFSNGCVITIRYTKSTDSAS